MAEHGTVQYATATGNDYPAHEHSYESFIFFTFTGIITVVNILLSMTVGGVLGHWFLMVAMFIITAGGAITGMLGSSKTSSYVAFVLCFLIFGFSALS